MSPESASRLRDRIGALRRRLDDAGLSGLLVTHLPNVFYLTGFSGTAGAVLVTRDLVRLIVDSRYATAARGAVDAAPDGLITVVDVESSYEATYRDLLQPRGGRVGIEAAHLSVAQFEWLQLALAERGPELASTRDLVEVGRVVKDDDELEILTEAGGRISAVMDAQIDRLRPGLSELEVAANIDHAIRGAGFERPAFDTIVASGPQTALPHARPGSRVLGDGDLVLLDFGGVLRGYCVDLTRVASLGASSDDARVWHGAVRAAHQAAVEAVRVGTTTTAVDQAARSTLESAGLGEAFGHGTGHGLGIEVHEAPRVGRRRVPEGRPDPEDVPLELGMVFTVEPGAYLPGRGGVRLEDDVVVTSDGHRLLTDVSLDLREVG